MLKKNKYTHLLFPGSDSMKALSQFVAAALVVCTSLVHADSIFGVTSNTDVRVDSIASASNPTTLLAGGTGSPADHAAVFVFQTSNN